MLEYILLPGVCLLFIVSAFITLWNFKFARYIHIGGIVLLGSTVAFFVVMFLVDNFDYAIVFSNSSTDLFVPYKLGAFFTTVEGQMLGMVLIMNIIWAVQVKFLKNHEYLGSKVLTMISLISILLLVVIIYINPFEAASGAHSRHFTDGRGLDQGYQSVWMLVHPLVMMIALGFTGVVYCLGISPVLSSDIEHVPINVLRFNALASLGMVLLGIGTWAGWAGMDWGRGWGFDAYEWFLVIMLVLTLAAVHGVEQVDRGKLQRAYPTLLMAPFLIVLIGAYIVYSGKWNTIIERTLESKWFGSPFDSSWLVLTLAFMVVIGTEFAAVFNLFKDKDGSEGEIKVGKGDNNNPAAFRSTISLVIPFILLAIGFISLVVLALDWTVGKWIMAVLVGMLLIEGGIEYLVLNRGKKGDRAMSAVHSLIPMATILLAVYIFINDSAGIVADIILGITVLLILGAGLIAVIQALKVVRSYPRLEEIIPEN